MADTVPSLNVRTTEYERERACGGRKSEWQLQEDLNGSNFLRVSMYVAQEHLYPSRENSSRSPALIPDQMHHYNI